MKDFGSWFTETADRVGTPKKRVRVLTPEAQEERDDFERDRADGGCTCFIAPPCGYCTHPGNPLNQEVDECWMEVEE
jgi:hypothetical protein